MAHPNAFATPFVSVPNLRGAPVISCPTLRLAGAFGSRLAGCAVGEQRLARDVVPARRPFEQRRNARCSSPRMRGAPRVHPRVPVAARLITAAAGQLVSSA